MNMAKYLELADKALAKIKTAPDCPVLPNDINDINDKTLHGISLAELRDLAGKDWPDLEANPELLECFAEIVSIRKMRERGEVPPTYTAMTVCRHCGPVPIFPGVAEKVEGCPWCMNRAAGRPMPKEGDHGRAA
jgi:hypothetical protein